MFTSTVKQSVLAAAIAGFCSLANADTTWGVLQGSSFYDSSANATLALSGSITTRLVDFSDQEPYASHGWSYIRHEIFAIDIKGGGTPFSPADFGFGPVAGGAIDFTDQEMPLHIGQVQIIFQDGTRFSGWPNSFAGSAYAPSLISLTDLAPFVLHENPYYQGLPLDIQSADRLSLFLAPIPEPDAYALLLSGLGLLGVVASLRGKVANLLESLK